jgi:hypothetical protein
VAALLQLGFFKLLAELVYFHACGMARMWGLLQPAGVVGLFHACGMARMPGLAPAGESLSLLTKKGTQRNHPEIARKPAVLTNFEAPPKLGER